MLEPPKVALYEEEREDNYIAVAIDGNRRTYACQLLENGYKTEINGIPSTLFLPNNWRVLVANISAEKITPEIIDKIRFHSTEQHRHFSLTAIATKITNEATNWAIERGLTLKKIRTTQTLNDELIDYLGKRFQIERIEVLKWLKRISKHSTKYKKEVELPLHEGRIGTTIAIALSQGIPKEKIPVLIEIIEENKNRNINSERLKRELNYAKKNQKTHNTDIVKTFRERVKTLTPLKNISLDFPLQSYEKLNEERQKRKTTWTELMVPIIEKNIHLFLSS